jgi:hypothetical protein
MAKFCTNSDDIMMVTFSSGGIYHIKFRETKKDLYSIISLFSSAFHVLSLQYILLCMIEILMSNMAATPLAN